MQLHLLSTLLFVFTANADNLAVGLSYGIKKVPIGWRANLVIALITLIGTVSSMLFGKSILLLLPEHFAGILGGLIIILIGLAGLIRFFVQKRTGTPENTRIQALTIKEAVLLALALTINNIGLGIGASITGLPISTTAACSFLSSVLLLRWGNRIGRSRLAKLVGSYAEPLANLLIISLGIYEIFI